MTYPAEVIPLYNVQDFSRYGFSDNAENFRAGRVLDSQRWKEMTRWQWYFECKQHDWKRYDFDGRMIRPGDGVAQPLISADRASWYVPLKMRRPSTPYRLGRRIVSSFTTMVFGESRWPDVVVAGDEEATEFLNALIEETGLPAKMAQARNLGGAVGTVGISWCYHDGVPNVEVHNGKGIVVHEWSNKTKLRPKHVTEIYKYQKDHWDPKKKAYVREVWWHRQDWTEVADVVFKECKAEGSAEPNWEVDEEQTTVHNDGFCHFVYVQNIPPTEGIDGMPDCDGVWDQLDTLDILNSVLSRGGVLNLDPTLKLKMDPELVDHAFVRKGSDNALVTGETGDANYMELSGSSITAGLSLKNDIRDEVLETSECVIPDPDKVAAAGTSSVALKMVYAPMLGKCDQFREYYGKALRELLRQMLIVAQKLYNPKTETQLNEETGEEEDVDVVSFIRLPPKVWSEPLTDPETGEELEEETIHIDTYTPGQSAHIELSWGPYFKPTADDQSKLVMTLTGATGGRQFCAAKTALELFASSVSRDPDKMAEQLDKELNREREQQAAMMEQMGTEPGGPVEGEGDETDTDVPDIIPEPGAEPTISMKEEITVSLTATDVANIVTVNEGRQAQGLGPLMLPNGQPDPDGNLMVAEFKAKRASIIAMAAQADKGEDPNAPTPPAPTGFPPQG